MPGCAIVWSKAGLQATLSVLLIFCYCDEALAAQAGGRGERSVQDAVDDARSRGRTETTLPSVRLEESVFRGLDGALAYSFVSVVHTSLEEKHTIAVPERTRLDTYLRFKILQNFLPARNTLTSAPRRVPEDVAALRGDEFLVEIPLAGSTVIDGVRVKSGNRLLEEFAVGEHYLLIVAFYGHPKIAALPFGLRGVFRVADSGVLDPLYPEGDVAQAFKREGLARLGDVRPDIIRRLSTRQGGVVR